jgi:hypothetical protein
MRLRMRLLRGDETHGDVPDVWVNISLPHGIRQLEAGHPRALLGLDAVEHLVSSGRRFRTGIRMLLDIDAACTKRERSSFICEDARSALDPSVRSPLYGSPSGAFSSPGGVTNSTGSS